MAFTYRNDRPGGQSIPSPEAGDPPVSSLVQAFQGQGEAAADSIVLRGYLGRSDIMKRALDYLEGAKRVAGSRRSQTRWPGLTEESGTSPDGSPGPEVEAEALAAGVPTDKARELASRFPEVPDAVNPEPGPRSWRRK